MNRYWASFGLIIAFVVSIPMVTTAQDNKNNTVLIRTFHLPSTARVAAESNNLIVFADVDSTYIHDGSIGNE